MRGECWTVSVLVCVAAMGGSSPALAQAAAAQKWEVELHGGGLLPSNPAGGTVSLPGPGEAFMTVPLATSPAQPSRYEPSWYFGDGTALFNQSATALGQLPNHIVALDPVLAGPLAEYRRGGSLGVRVSRVMTPRLTAEVSFDYGLPALQIRAANEQALEATRASYIPAWRGLILFNPNRVLNSVTSTSNVTNGSARQLFTSGTININLTTAGSIRPYVSAGVGVASIAGDLPSAGLRGRYQFLLGSGAPIDETDTVTAIDARTRHTLAGVLGGGMKYHVSSRWGLRFDIRLNISTSAANTDLDATPAAARLTPQGRGALGGSPSIQFSNNSTDPLTFQGVTAVAASSLTAPALRGHRTFAGTGTAVHTNVTVGLYWRF